MFALTDKVRMKMLAAQTANQTALAESLSAVVAAATAAESLADHQKLKNMKWADLQKHVAVVEKLGTPIPWRVARAATRKYAEILLEGEKFSDWVLAGCPWGDKHKGAWSLEAPQMWLLIGEGEAEMLDLQEHVLGCFFHDVGLQMVINITNDAPRAKNHVALLGAHLSVGLR